MLNFEHYLAGGIFAALFMLNHDYFGVGQLFITHIKVLPVWILLFYGLSRRRASLRHPVGALSQGI
jgi:hypothetical protein